MFNQRNIIIRLILFYMFLGASPGGLLAAEEATIKGFVLSAGTKEPLPGANVYLEGTMLGSSTDLDGYFSIINIPPGSYTLKIKYIGYKQLDITIEVKAEDVITKTFELSPEALEGETIVVTAQAEGQHQAINQQLASLNIANVVSSAKIQELPDANAAESVGRLPGVSVIRSGGEGESVVIRGLAPKYNAITINGIRMSSSDAENRGINLSMISSNMLAGIQVVKTFTPDMDANVFGGVVNFDLREASGIEEGKSNYGFVIQGGHSGLANAKNSFRNYKIEGIYSNRLFENKFGLFLQGAYENRNLSSNELGASYTSQGNSQVDYLTEDITLDDIQRERIRGNIVLTLDYRLPDGKIKFSNLLSTSNTESHDRQQFYNVDRGTNTQNFNALYKKSTLSTISNILSLEHKLSLFDMKVSLSHAYSETENPKDWEVEFVNSSAGIQDFGFSANVDPRDVVAAANHDTTNTLLQFVSTERSFSRERSLVGSLDLERQLNLSNKITTTIKFGGSYTHQTRSYDLNVTDGQQFGFASGAAVISQLQAALPWFRHRPGDNLNVPFTLFIDRNFEYGEFLDSEYKMVYPLDFARLKSMVDYMYANQLEDNITYNNNIGSSITEDYDGNEDITAAYIMATFKIGSKFNITPGIRYQQLKTTYTAPQGLQGPTSFAEYAHQSKTVTLYHPFWLPALLLQYKPLEWFDIRLAHTNTVSYPDYNALAPRINVAQSAGTLQYNGFNLAPAQSKNFDAYFSFYNNTIGLFTIGGFYKQITDLIFPFSFTPSTANELVQYYPEWVENKEPLTGITVSTFVNNSYKVDNIGLELDWQTHFWYLPGLLSGLVLSANYTHIFSEAEYPYQMVIPGRPPQFIDTTYVAPLLYQPDDILNITLGYDYKGFSLRISTLYADRIFTGPTQWEQLRTFTDAYTRWDISLKQDLPYFEGLQVYSNLTNISGARDVSSISAATGVPRRIENYGSIIELGLRGNF